MRFEAVNLAPACLAVALLVTGCATVFNSATNDLANNLSAAILNQDDPQTVRDGAPAYLLMLDSFASGSPGDAGILDAAAELYAAYAVLFVEDKARAARLTIRSREYAARALCVRAAAACGLDKAGYDQYMQILKQLNKKAVPELYTYAMASLAYVKANSGEPSALTDLPRVKAALDRMQALDNTYQPVNREHYLAVLDTLRPPAMGGDFKAGLQHFENAMKLSQGRDLTINVDFADYYARTLYDRELHDRLLRAVIRANPEAEGHTLFNTIAQKRARALLASADDYF